MSAPFRGLQAWDGQPAKILLKITRISCMSKWVGRVMLPALISADPSDSGTQSDPICAPQFMIAAEPPTRPLRRLGA
jgi:hypothetical protein